MQPPLPAIPAKRYFTIGEVSDLCGVKAHVLRYWEQEFTQLRPVKRRGNRRYYQHHEVLLIRRIRQLLYEEGFTISGARNRLTDAGTAARSGTVADESRIGVDAAAANEDRSVVADHREAAESVALRAASTAWVVPPPSAGLADLRGELLAIRSLLES
jgi:DNA-binding transcriptional MerR regulator